MCSRDSIGGPEVVDRPTRRSESGRETLPEVWKWLGDPTGGPEWSGDSPKSSTVDSIPSRRSGTG